MLRFRSRANVRPRLLVATAIAVTAAVAAPASHSAAASKPKVIRVGALLSVTGPGSTLGKSSRAALQVALDAWNAKLKKQGKRTRFALDVFDTGLMLVTRNVDDYVDIPGLQVLSGQTS